jgi:hypothetical protein
MGMFGYRDGIQWKKEMTGELTGRSNLAIQLLHVSQELARDSLLVVDLDRTLDKEVRDVVPGSEVYRTNNLRLSNPTQTLQS